MALGPRVAFEVDKNVHDETFGKLYLIYRYMDLDLHVQLQSIIKPDLISITCRLCERLTIISLQLGRCDHLYCIQCLDILIRFFDRKCSECKKPFDPDTLDRWTAKEDEMGKIKSRCPNYFWAGCERIFELKDLPSHILHCELGQKYKVARNDHRCSALESVVKFNFDKKKKIEFNIDSINHYDGLKRLNLLDENFNLEGPNITLEIFNPGEITVSVAPRYNFKTGKIGLKFRSNATVRQVIEAPFPSVKYEIKVPPAQVRSNVTEEMFDVSMGDLEKDNIIKVGQDMYIRRAERLFSDNITLNVKDELHYVSCFDSNILKEIAKTQTRDSVKIEVIIEPTPPIINECNGNLTFTIEDYKDTVELISKRCIERILVGPSFLTSASGYRVRAELFVDDAANPIVQTLYVSILSGRFDNSLRRQNGFLLKVEVKNCRGRYINVFTKVSYDNPIRADIDEPLTNYLISSNLEMKLCVHEVQNDSNEAKHFLDFKKFDIKPWNAPVSVALD